MQAMKVADQYGNIVDPRQSMNYLPISGQILTTYAVGAGGGASGENVWVWVGSSHVLSGRGIRYWRLHNRSGGVMEYCFRSDQSVATPVQSVKVGSGIDIEEYTAIRELLVRTEKGDGISLELWE